MRKGLRRQGRTRLLLRAAETWPTHLQRWRRRKQAGDREVHLAQEHLTQG